MTQGVGFVFLIWCGIFVNFFLGLCSYPDPSTKSFTFILCIFAALPLGALTESFFSRAKDSQKTSNKNAYNTANTTIVWLSCLCAACSFLSLIFLMQAGRTVSQAINETEVVRQRGIAEISNTTVITNFFGYQSLSLLFISFCYLKYAPQSRNNMTKLVASCFGVACILVFYFVNVNRTAFYILAILLLCSFSLFHKLSFSQLIKVMPKWAIAALLVTALVIPSYVVFIATARSSGEGENAQIVSDNIKLRYHLQTLEQIDYNTACGVYKVHWYTTHPIANLFSYIDTNAPLTYFDGRGTFFYPISQYNKIFPSDQIDYQESWNRQISDIESAGIPVWQWCTGYATIINDFGIFGCLIFVFILSTILSAATRSFLLTHDWLAGLTALWISILLIVLWTNFPIDTFFQLSIYTTILALGIRFIITRRCFL